MLVAGFNPSFVIVILSLWRMGVAACVLDQHSSDGEIVLAMTLVHPVLVVIEHKRKIKAQQMLLEEAVALEEVKNFWCGSQDIVPQIDARMVAALFIDRGAVVPVSYEDLLAGCCQMAVPSLQAVMKGLRSGEAIVIR